MILHLHKRWCDNETQLAAIYMAATWLASVSQQATGANTTIATGFENVFCDPVLDLPSSQKQLQAKQNSRIYDFLSIELRKRK